MFMADHALQEKNKKTFCLHHRMYYGRINFTVSIDATVNIYVLFNTE